MIISLTYNHRTRTNEENSSIVKLANSSALGFTKKENAAACCALIGLPRSSSINVPVMCRISR